MTARRLEPFSSSVFAGITALAASTGAVDLGQGYPNFDGPDFVKEAAAEAMRSGHNQYARTYGEPVLTEAIAARFGHDSGIEPDPDREVTVTSGCTEALAAACLGLLEPGDEVIVFEPFYDAYVVDTVLAHATPVHVTLRPPRFEIDEQTLRAAVTDATKAVIVNTPHNPTGHVLGTDELEAIASVCREHDLVVISDEVYEHLVYEGSHRSIATLPGMWDRTVTCSSLGKTFSLTGWKVGWTVGPEHLTSAVRTAHQTLTFATATPLQYGAAAALAADDEYYRRLLDGYRERRDLLVDGLNSVGFHVTPPEGTYFVYTDHTVFGFPDDVAFVEHLIADVGVAAIPPSAFYRDKADGAPFVRFAFCKDLATLEAAVDRLEGLRQA